MLVLIVFTSSKSNTPLVPANVNVDTLIDFDCVRVAVLVMVKPLPVKPFTVDKVPISKLEAVWKLRLPVPMLPANTLITEFDSVSV